MFPKTIVLSALLLFGLINAPAPAPKAVSAEALGPVKYEVRYILKGINTKVADVAISLENSKWNGQNALHSHAKINASSVFRLFMAAEYIADAYFTTGSQEPLYSINPIKKGKKEGKFECIYDRDAKVVTSEFAPPSAKPVTGTYPLDGRTMDLLSLLQYVRFHDIPVGTTLDMHLLMKGKCVAATLVNQGPDNDKFPGQSSERLFLKMLEMGLMENGSGNEITVWRSTNENRLILGLETTLSSGAISVSFAE